MIGDHERVEEKASLHYDHARMEEMKARTKKNDARLEKNNATTKGGGNN